MEKDAIKALDELRQRITEPAVLAEVEASFQAGEATSNLIQILKDMLEAREEEARHLKAEKEARARALLLSIVLTEKVNQIAQGDIASN